MDEFEIKVRPRASEYAVVGVCSRNTFIIGNGREEIFCRIHRSSSGIVSPWVETDVFKEHEAIWSHLYQEILTAYYWLEEKGVCWAAVGEW